MKKTPKNVLFSDFKEVNIYDLEAAIAMSKTEK